MKKIMLIMSLIVGSFTLPSLSASTISTNNVFLQDELSFSTIALSDLPSVIKNIALDKNEGMVITGAKVATTDEGKKVYKITLSDIEGEETTVYYNEDGSKYKK